MAKIGEPYPLLLRDNLVDVYQSIGGIDTVSSSISLGQTKFRDCQNIDFYPLGGISWRNGYTTLNSSPVSNNQSIGLNMARYSVNGNIALYVCGGKLYKMATLNGTWSDITNGVTITNANNPVVFGTINDITVMCDNVDTTWQTVGGANASALGGSPVFTSALFCLEYRGYMFYGQTVESGTRQYDRLRFSDVNAPNSFTMLGSNNFIDIASKSNGDLKGGVNYNGYLYLFKRNAIYQIGFYPTQVNSSGVIFPFTQAPNPIVEDVGTQSHRSITKFTTPITNARQSGVELVFFVDQFGIPRIFDGSTTIQIGYPISRSRDTTITSLTNMDRSQLPYVWSVNYPDRNQIFCFVSNANQQMDTCWVLDYSVGFSWGRHKFAKPFACGALFEQTNGTWKPYLADYTGTVYQSDSGTSDNGTAIISYATWGDIYNSSPTIRSKWIWTELKGTSSGPITIDIYPDGSDSLLSSISTSTTLASTQTTWGTSGPGGTMTWGVSLWAKAGLTTNQKELGIDAKTIRVRLSNSTINNTANIEGFTVYGIPQGTSQV